MKNLFLALCCGVALVACNKPKEETTQSAPPAAPPQQEIGDAKYIEIGRTNLRQLTSGDVDGWVAAFADSAKYYWSGGDSLIGKRAIQEYWKKRRGDVIESMTILHDIWVPLKVNVSQQGSDPTPGNWLLGWYQVDVTYKNHKPLKIWVHTDYHFDAADKIDFASQYVDRAPINATLAKK